MNLPSPTDHHSLCVELRFDGAAPTGHVRVTGGEPRAFSGWVGLVSAVEELVTEAPTPSPGPQSAESGRAA